MYDGIIVTLIIGALILIVILIAWDIINAYKT